MPKIDHDAAPVKTGSIYPAPYDAQMAGRSSVRLGEAGGLTQFGANLVTLEPGARSSLRHWHASEDEFLMVTEGNLVLIEDQGETPINAGDCAAFPAGVANGHCLENRSERRACFLVVGTKAQREVVTYPGLDLVLTQDNGTAAFTRGDGRPYSGKESGQ